MSDFKFHPTVLAQHLAILGRTGSGKSYTAKGAVESLLTDKRRVCILDPTGIWYGLRSSADGKRAGFAVVVFGGPHADVPINEHSGAALAHIIATQNLPAIVDMSEMLIGQRHRFVTDFAEALYRENRTPLHLVIDEAAAARKEADRIAAEQRAAAQAEHEARMKAEREAAAIAAKKAADKAAKALAQKRKVEAAAPLLLAALKWMLDAFYEDPLEADTEGAVELARAAIAAAEAA